MIDLKKDPFYTTVKDFQFDKFTIKTDFVLSLGDFGLTTKFKVDSAPLTTYDDRGNDPYKAPEVFYDKSMKNKCDVWSLGVLILWLLLKEEKPRKFYSLSQVELHNMIDDKLGKEKDIHFNSILKQMVVLNPTNRISAEDLYEYLQTIDIY